MGNKKNSTASAAQAAADLYAKTRTTSATAASFTFGARFADQVSSGLKGEHPTSSMQSYETDMSPMSVQVQQCIQHLSKTDARTRQRALSGLKCALEENPNQAFSLMEYWSKQFPKLMKDTAKHVRIGSCELTLTLSTCVGRSMGRIIKEVFPSLFFAQYDEKDVAMVASTVLQAMLPGNKMEKAIVLCIDQLVQEVREGILALEGDVNNAVQDCREILQHMKGADALLKMHREEVSSAVCDIIKSDEFTCLCLHGKHAGIRRESYSLVASMAMHWQGEPLLTVPFAKSIFACLNDEDGHNYMDALAMIIAFGRMFVNVWEMIDVDVDFYQPIRRIAVSVNQNNSLIEVNRSFLPLISLIPKDHCDSKQVSCMLEALWNAHDNSSHNRKACKLVQDTIKECIEYHAGPKRSGSMGPIFELILGSLERQPISTCSQQIASSCIRDISWVDEDVILLLDELEKRTAMIVDEHILSELGPFLSSIPTSNQFIQWQLCVLEKSLELSHSFWMHNKIDFVVSMFRNFWGYTRQHSTERNSDLDGVSSLWMQSSDIPCTIEFKLLERASMSFDETLIEALSLFVLISPSRSASFSQVLSTLVLKPKAASRVISKIGDLDDVDDETIYSLRSTSLDELFLKCSNDTIMSANAETLEFCNTILKQGCSGGLVSNDCIKKVTRMLLALMHQHISIDSKAILLQLLDSIMTHYEADVISFDNASPIWPFTLVTCWEEFLLDLCGGISAPPFDGGWRQIVEHNKTLKSTERILKTGFSRHPLDTINIQVLIDSNIISEMEISNLGDAEEGTDHALPMYCMVSFCLSAMEEQGKVDLLLAFEKVLKPMPAMAIKIFEELDQKTLCSLTKENDGLVLISDVFNDCLISRVEIGPFIHRIMDYPQCYVSILKHQSREGDNAVNGLATLLSAGLENPDSFSREHAIQFCKSELFNALQDPWRLKVLTRVASTIRKDASLLHQSGLASYTCSQLDRDDQVFDIQEIHALVACLGLYAEVGTHGWDLLNPNIPVWYMDSKIENKWLHSYIISRDDSIQPPSFLVQGSTSVRETEPTRLRVAGFGSFSLPYPSGDLKEIENSQLIIYEAEEIQKIIILVRSICRCEGLLLSDVPGLGPVLRVAVHPSVWKNLSSEERCSILEIIANSMTHSSSQMDKMTGDFSASLISMVNEVIGTSYSSVTETLTFMTGLRSNVKLRNVPKIAKLYDALEEDMRESLFSYQSRHADAIAVAAHVYISLSVQTLEFSKERVPKATIARISLDLISIFYGIGYFMTLTRSIFDLKKGSRSHVLWLHLIDLLQPLSSGIQALEIHESNIEDMLFNSRSRNPHFRSVPSMLPLCLNNGTSGRASRAAFLLVLHSIEESSIWYCDPESFYETMEDIIAHSERHTPDVIPGLLCQCGMSEYIANGLVDPSSVDFIPSWTLIVSFLLNQKIEPSQKETLVSMLKEFNILTSAILDLIGNALQKPQNAATNLEKARTGIPIRIQDNFAHYLQYLNNDMNSFVSQDSGIHVPLEVLLVGLLASLPVVCRTWFLGLNNRQSKIFMQDFVKTNISPILIKEEFEMIDIADSGDEETSFNIKSFNTKNQILASLKVEDGHSIDLKVSFPKEYPLKAPSANLERYVGISESKARKWNLSIAAFLMNRNGTVSEVIQTWKKNVSQEFEGHEDCLICYSIIQPSTGQLPRLTCKTCQQKYHGTCLYKWFKTSGKSNCVHCQSPW